MEGIHFLGLLLILCSVGQIQAEEDPGCLCLEPLPTGPLANPTVLTHAGDGSGRRFLVEQIGLGWVLDDMGQRLPEPFFNLTEVVKSGDRVGSEEGFLAMEFHPQFAENGLLYLYYSITLEGQMCTVGAVTGDVYSRLSEVHIMEGDENKIDAASERVIMDFCQPFGNHNGGDIQFDDDGLMLVFLGDGGLGGDPFDQSLNKMSFLGKALRIDIDRRDPGLEYGIPEDNPFLDDPEALPEMYAYGLRNPWRVDRDSGDRVTGEGAGRIFIGDVGQNGFEEIDLLEPGVNYGWAAFEARTCYKRSLCPLYENAEDIRWPLHYYPHSVGRCIIQGNVYRGCSYPKFNGWIFFGDYVNGKLFRMLDGEGPEGWPVDELFTCATCPPGTTNQYETSILSFGKDQQGEVYMLTTATANPNVSAGKVYRIVDPDSYPGEC